MSLLGYINNGLNQSLNGIVSITDGNGTTISDGTVSSNSMSVSSFTASSLSSNNLTITGTITLPNYSILDNYLSLNVCFLNATQTLINKTLTSPIISTIVNTGTLTLPTSTDTLIGRATTDTLSNKTIDTGIFTTISTFNGYVDTNAGLAVNLGQYLTFGNSTNTIFSQIGQYGNDLSITNYGTGSIVFSSPVVDFTNTYSYFKGGTNSLGTSYNTHFPYSGDNKNYITGETHLRGGLVYLDYGSIAFNSSGLSLCSIYQANTAFMINNTNVGGTIQFRALNSSGISSIPLTISTSTLTLNTDINILQSGTGILSQSGTGTNILKGSNFNGNVSVRGANSLFLYNTANTISTQISQNGATLKFTNPSNPSQYSFDAYDGFGSLYTYTLGSTFTSGGDIVLNTTSLTLKDGTNSTTNMTQASGNCNIQNTKSSGSIKFTTQDATTNTRDLVIAYTGVSIPSLLTCSNGLFVSGALTLPNNSISDNALSSNIPKLNTSNTFSNTNTFNALVSCSNGLTLSSGALILPSNSISDSALSSNIPKLNVSNTFSNTNTFQNSITLQSNINLQSTFTTPTSGQLGYKHQGTILNVPTPASMTTATPYYLASLTLPVGVWNVFGQYSFQYTATSTSYTESASISTSSTTMNADNMTQIRYSGGSTEIVIRRVNDIFTSSGTTALYLNIMSTYITGSAPQYTSTTQANVRFYAVRIA
jgi:hypothetical protein